MKRQRHLNEPIAFALKQAENGTAVEEICRKLGVSEATFRGRTLWNQCVLPEGMAGLTA